MATAAASSDENDDTEENDSVSVDNDTGSTQSCSELTFYDAPDPEEESWKFADREIFEIAQELGSEWYSLGIILGYKHNVLDVVSDLYTTNPSKRNFLILVKWCNTVSSLQLNTREQLAVHLSQAGRTDLAQKVGVYFKDVYTPKSMYQHIEKIAFDRDRLDMVSTNVESVVVNQFNILCIGDNHEKTGMIADKNPEQEHKMQSQGTYSVQDGLGTDNAFLPCTERNDRKIEISKLVQMLALQRFFPGKISLQDVRKIKSADLLLSESLIPWLLLDKLIMLNYKAREHDLDHLYEKRNESPLSDNEDSDVDIFDEPESNQKINPIDVFLVTFLSCDLPLKQEIIFRLFTCRLAIPVIYRNENNDLILSKWAMKQIVLSKHTPDSCSHIDALQCEAKRVAFIRLGDPSLSKSKILNELLSEQNHPTFYNRDCPLGASKRMIAEGTVEGAWYMPSGGTNDVFNELVMFLNLRGDCVHHTDELNLLCVLSDIIVVHTNVENFEKQEIKSTLMKLQEKNLYIIYALESSEKSNVKSNEILKAFRKHMEKFRNKMKFFNLQAAGSGFRSRSAADKIKELRKLLSEALTLTCQSSIIKHIDKMSNTDDKMSSHCLESNTFATMFMRKLKNECGLKKKQDVLPLQGKVWKEYCVAVKTYYRSKSSEEREILKNIVIGSRHKQLSMFSGYGHPYVDEILKHFMALKDNPLSFSAYISWIMLDFDDESRNVLPMLRSNYQDLWTEMKLAKVKANGAEYSRIRKLVDEAENELVAASFGLEHIIRELGQVHEAIVCNRLYSPDHLQTSVEFASLCLRLGYPFEIMDGDTSMVPINWVKAVFNQLKRDIGDKKLLAISVLGVQSSGKSTLLNTMFGLKFPVSAGRCTRGVYVQLVPVAKTALPFSYVLVVDTEGLRAPELADQNYSHDNELATFVLGLGNITLINIKGENTSEMENVLQIAVHAFLRLKMANGRLKLQQTCIFTHQNVPADNASNAMIHARQKMMDKLDKMTAAAADQEGLANITSFNQVIEIDPKSHMWYFSDLYFGDPPMAPINVGYSEKVAKVKSHILFDIAVKKKFFLTVSETLSCIEDLRNGILSDDFVFSFRNSLEMKAYYSMESKFNKILWDIESTIHEFRKKASAKFARCSTDEQLNTMEAKLASELRENVLDRQNLCLEQLNNFIDNSSLREIMEQWRQSRVIKINEFVCDLERKTIKHIKNNKQQIAAELVRTKKRKVHEQEIKKKAVDLAARFKENVGLSAALLWQNFNDMWKKWVGELEQDEIYDDKPVRDQIEETLYNQFLSDRHLIVKELKGSVKPNTRTKDWDKLQFSFPVSCILDGGISYQPDMYVTRSKTKQINGSAVELINIIFAKIDSFISNVKYQDGPFEKSWVTGIFLILTESIDQHNRGYGEITNFKFTATLKVKLAVHITRHITEVFTDLEWRYRKNHNVAAQMKDYKNMAWQQFKDTVTNEHDTFKMTNLLINTIEKLIFKEVEKCLPSEVVKFVIDECFSTKYSLILTMMTDLAINENFEQFHWYIIDSKSYAREWIIKFTNSRLFDTRKKGNSRYNRIVTKLIEQYLYAVRDSLNFIRTIGKSTNCSMRSWINDLEQSLAEFLPIPVDMFDFYKNSHIVDRNAIIEQFIVQLKQCETRLLKDFSKPVKKRILWKESNPYAVIFDKLWGCEHVCPFCRETCQKTTKCHVGEPHTCVQHRPPGLKGVQQVETQYMSWEACNYKVYSDISFYCGASDQKCQTSGKCNATGVHGNLHFYRQYASFIPDWEIEPSPRREASLYWMWFTYRFRKELKQTYGYIMPPVVETWKKITKEDAINSLKMRGYLSADI